MFCRSMILVFYVTFHCTRSRGPSDIFILITKFNCYGLMIVTENSREALHFLFLYLLKQITSLRNLNVENYF